MTLRAAASLVALCSTALPAHSNNAWICTYPGYSDGHAPVIVRFHIEGDDLIEDNFHLRHKILQNTEFAVVAAWSIAEIEPDHTKPSIGAFIVIIDKRSLRFQRSNAVLGEPRDALAVGNCIAG